MNTTQRLMFDALNEENDKLLAENTEQKQLIKELKTFLIPLIPLLKAARLTVVAEHGELLLTKAKAHV